MTTTTTTTKTSRARGARRDLYQEVTDRVLAMLEEGVAPWERPWEAGAALDGHRNLTTGIPYRGANIVMLWIAASLGGYSLPLWCTFKQARTLGGSVRKGEKGTGLVFWKVWERDGENGREAIPILRAFTVFNIDQLELPEGKREELEADLVKDRELREAARMSAEELRAPMAGYIDQLRGGLRHGGGRACYWPMFDRVELPEPASFEGMAEYASTLFHELAHSTGHPDRLHRFEADLWSPDRHAYSREELVAELTAAFLMERTGIRCEKTERNSAAYLASWSKALAEDPRAVVVAAGKAQKAADHILERAAEVQEVAAA